MPHFTIFLLAALIGYLLGSIPFGAVLTKIAGKGDIRTIGSGNIGATNVLRTGSRGLALLTLLLDGCKGAVAILLVETFAPNAVPIAAASAFLGHLYPIWLSFRGGKGVATFLGIMVALNFWVGIACGATWLLMALLCRFSSLASLSAAVIAPLFAWSIDGTELAILALLLSSLIILKHRDNIKRLAKGEEPRIGQS